MKQLLLFLLFILWVYLDAAAQSSVIQGKVTDSTSQTILEGAEVLLIAQGRSKSALKTHSGNKGFFFRNLMESRYAVVTNLLGFSIDTTYIEVRSSDTVCLNIRLCPLQNELGNVIVKAVTKPITLKGDTVSFNAESFAPGPGSLAEDLFRNLPGVSVDKDGNITFQGERVDKILLNGQEFFLSDIKNANSLPAEMIASIELFKTQSDRARFSGIKEISKTNTLNIKTKKGMDNAWIGNFYAGKGRKKNYAAGGSFTKLAKDIMLKGTFKLNNINNRFVGVENKNPAAQTGIQSTADFDVNLMKKWGDKLVANFSLTGNNQKIEAIRITDRRTIFNDSSLLEERSGVGGSHSQNYPVSLKFTYNPNSRNQWEFTSGITTVKSSIYSLDTASIYILRKDGIRYINSSTQVRNTSEQSSDQFSNQLEWRHRFIKPGRTLQLSVGHVSHKGKGAGSLFSVLNNFSTGDSSILSKHSNQQYTENNVGKRYSSSVTYTEPLYKDNILMITYTLDTKFYYNDKRSYEYDSLLGGYFRPAPLTTNVFQNNATTHRIESSLGKVSGKINYSLGLNWQYTKQDNSTAYPQYFIKQHFVNLFPKASLHIITSRRQRVNLDYLGYSEAPDIAMLQPIPDLSNPLLIVSGNPNLKQVFNHNLSVGFNAVSTKSFNSILSGISGAVTQNKIVPSVILLPGGVQQQTYVNVNGVYNVGVATFYSFGFLSKKNGKRNSGSIHTRLFYGRDVGFINGNRNNIYSFTWAQTLKVNYGISRFISADFSGSSDLSFYRYSMNSTQNSRTWNQNAIMNLSCKLPLGFYIQTGFLWTRLGSSGILPSQTNSILNAAIYKRLFAGQKWQVRLSAFDIFNSGKNVIQGAAQNHIYTTRTNQLQRMFLISLVYNYKVFPAKTK